MTILQRRAHMSKKPIKNWTKNIQVKIYCKEFLNILSITFLFDILTHPYFFSIAIKHEISRVSVKSVRGQINLKIILKYFCFAELICPFTT